MKVLFVFPKVENVILPSYAPLGLMSIATYLNQNGHEAIIVDRFYETESIESVIEKHTPDMVGISVISHTFIKDATYISTKVKEYGIPVVWGGSAGSSIDEVALRSGVVDYVSYNEGEYTWLDMANAFDLQKSFDDIQGISYLKNGEYIRNENRPFIDLTELPDIDWKLVDPRNYFQKNYGMERMLSTYVTKGCYGKCGFCYNSVYHCSQRRKRSLDSVMREIRYLVDEYEADSFEFADEALFQNRTEMIEFCDKLKEYNLDIRWACYLNAATISDKEDFELMYDSGCRIIYYGIESGSERMLKLMNKYSKTEKAKENIKKCFDSKILPVAMFIIGLPDEDEEDLRQTIKLAKSFGTAIVSFCYFTPLPKTQFYKKLVSEGRLVEHKTIEELGNIFELEELYANFTKVPTIDLITIRKYMRLRGLFRKGEGQAEKVISMTLKAWGKRGVVHFFYNAFFSGVKFISTCAIFFHPKIRKKYGLYFTK